MNLTHRDLRRAFTLVEVMVGCGVAAVVIAAAYAGVAAGFQTMQLTRENLRATQIMVERLEAIRGCGWAKLTNSPPGSFTEYYTPGTGVGGSGVLYSGTVVSEVPSLSGSPAYSNSLRCFTVTLRWTNRLSTGVNLPRTRTMATYVTEFGLKSYVTKY